jgi:hypothetical protein
MIRVITSDEFQKHPMERSLGIQARIKRRYLLETGKTRSGSLRQSSFGSFSDGRISWLSKLGTQKDDTCFGIRKTWYGSRRRTGFESLSDGRLGLNLKSIRSI